ncbi:MAG: hypothetical protein AAF410_03025 [Pseudomonadota bacterium]
MNTHLLALDNVSDDARQMMLRNSTQTLGSLTYGQFLYCLRTARFGDEDVRKINTKNKRLIIAQIENKNWLIEVREDIDSVIIENITIDTHHYSSLTEQSRLLMYLFSHCRMPRTEIED